MTGVTRCHGPLTGVSHFFIIFVGHTFPTRARAVCSQCDSTLQNVMAKMLCIINADRSSATCVSASR